MITSRGTETVRMWRHRREEPLREFELEERERDRHRHRGKERQKEIKRQRQKERWLPPEEQRIRTIQTLVWVTEPDTESETQTQKDRKGRESYRDRHRERDTDTERHKERWLPPEEQRQPGCEGVDGNHEKNSNYPTLLGWVSVIPE